MQSSGEVVLLLKSVLEKMYIYLHSNLMCNKFFYGLHRLLTLVRLARGL
jgi:hypothetical protein